MAFLARLMLLLIAASSPVVAAAQTMDYEVGQVWEYRARPGDEGSLVKIQRVEVLPGTAISVFHVSVIGVHPAADHPPIEIMHLPVGRESLDASVLTLSTSTAVFPDVREGYEEWRRAEGGVFTITIAAAVDAALTTIATGEVSNAP